mmetsp:Transcript_21730/g.16040  ORF Transcript_21730/g.16040 Transcript_21730/m.16040 type:complete len:471 (+) Transcript_21730:751-2163(+)
MTMVGVRCLGDCLPSIDDVVVEDEYRLWSNPESWTSGALPLEGEDVVIESGWNMLLDIDPPVLNIVEINGRLTFANDTDKHFQANYIFVRAGELIIGSAEAPYPQKAVITLHGLKDNQYIVFKDNIEAGDKILINTGKVEMHGLPRDGISRLTSPADAGDKSIYVETGLDWVEGDMIGIAPTNIEYQASDTATIVSYDPDSGRVTLDKALSYSHWGAEESTEDEYNVDMRGEVMLLTRNVKVQGQDVEKWGCQFITSDFVEADDKLRAGKTILDSVEIYNCSQYDTFKAALRFQGNSYRYSEVRNSAIHHGHGLGIYMMMAENVLLENNVVFDFVRFGLNVETSSNITIKGNAFIHVHKRVWEASKLEDILACAAICAYTDGDTCSSLHVTNNIFAGSIMYGAAAPGHTCGDKDDETFKDNVVHSIKGWGVAIFPADDEHYECVEGSDITVYKCTEAGLYSYFEVERLQF